MSTAVKLAANPEFSVNVEQLRLGVDHRNNDVSGMSVTGFDCQWPTLKLPSCID
jgi:hypothetical protein